MAYKNKPPKWDAQGTEPSSDLQTSGFSAGYKPPAPYFNYMFNRYTKSIQEVQDTAVQHVELVNEDLNTLLTDGFYYAASGNTIKNAPAGVEYFGLVVVKNSSVRFSQVLYSNTKTYVRWFNGGEWTAWGVYATNTDLEAVKSQIAGGTVKQANTLTSIELTNEDLNDLVPAEVTFYYAAGGNAVVNNPEETRAFGLMCYRSATGHRVQEIYTQDGVKFVRHCTSDINKEWTEWRALAFDADVKAALNKKGNVFYKLSDIGLTSGSETVEKIAELMPVYSSLIINVGAGNNSAMYPNSYGVLFVTKLDTTGRVVFEYSVKSLAKKYYGYYDASYSTPWTGWKEFVFVDGTIEAAKSVALQYDKEIRYTNKPASAVNIAHGYQWADDTKESLISGHKFFDGAGNLAPVYGSELYEGSKKISEKYSGADHTHNNILSVELTNEDLDDIKPDNVTFYFAAGNNTVVNNPAGAGSPFGMMCYKSAYGHRIQEVITDKNVKYIRNFTTQWNAWRKVLYGEDVVDNLVSTATNLPLSAKQGSVLDGKISALETKKDMSSYTSLLDYVLANPFSRANYKGYGFSDCVLGSAWGSIITLSPESGAGVLVFAFRNNDTSVYMRKTHYYNSKLEWNGDWIDIAEKETKHTVYFNGYCSGSYSVYTKGGVAYVNVACYFLNNYDEGTWKAVASTFPKPLETTPVACSGGYAEITTEGVLQFYNGATKNKFITFSCAYPVK